MKTHNHSTLIKILVAFALTATGHASFAQDVDLDGVPDLTDNCLVTPNPTQLDTDADLFGNACDADFNNDGFVNFLDLSALAAAFMTVNPTFDLNGDGVVNFLDISLFAPLFNTAPGPGATGASYATDVQPVLNTKCAPCHNGLGLGGHNVATVYADSFNPTVHPTCVGLNVGQCTLVRIRSGQMPPGAGCTGNPIVDSTNASCLTYDEQTLVFSWINGGLSP